jgi:hypothetical protein
MLPLGYTCKRATARPEAFPPQHVADILSLSDCISHNFTDWYSNEEHNGYYLFDSPSVIASLAEEYGVPLTGSRLLYFEAFEHEYDEEKGSWSPFSPNPSFVTHVEVPERKVLQGFDVACFEAGSAPGCSPLSCNDLANSIPVNEHCLIRTLEEARDALEQRRFEKGEPGPYRIVAVYTVERV